MIVEQGAASGAEHCPLTGQSFCDTVIASIPGVFFVLERDGRLLRWNPDLEAVTGRSPEHLAGLRLPELVPEKDQARVGRASSGSACASRSPKPTTRSITAAGPTPRSTAWPVS